MKCISMVIFHNNVIKQEITTALEWHLKLKSPDFNPFKPMTATFSAISLFIHSDKVMSEMFNTLSRFTDRLENKLSVGFSFGWFYSSFNNVPVAAEYVFPGDWTLGDGTHWDRKKEDLGFSGIIFGISLNF